MTIFPHKALTFFTLPVNVDAIKAMRQQCCTITVLVRIDLTVRQIANNILEVVRKIFLESLSLIKLILPSNFKDKAHNVPWHFRLQICNNMQWQISTPSPQSGRKTCVIWHPNIYPILCWLWRVYNVLGGNCWTVPKAWNVFTVSGKTQQVKVLLKVSRKMNHKWSLWVSWRKGATGQAL